MELQSDNFEYLGQWKGPTLTWSPWFNWGDQKVLQELGFNVPGEITTFDGHAFSNKKNRSGVEKLVQEHLAKDNLEFLFEYVRRFGAALEAFEKWSEIFEKFSEKDSIELLLEYQREFHEIVWYATLFVDSAIEKEIQARASAAGLDVDRLLQSVKPARLPYSFQKDELVDELREKLRERDLFALANKEKLDELERKAPDIHADMKALVAQYEWVGTQFYWGDPFDLEQLCVELQAEPRTELSNEQPREAPADIKRLLTIASELAWLRYQSADVVSLVRYKSRPFLTHLAGQMELTYGDIIWLTHEEIIEHVQQESRPDPTLVASRKVGHGAFVKDGHIVVITGGELANVISAWVPTTDTDVSEITGTIGNSGSASGRVRILKTPNEIEAFQDGEILVAPETTPGFVPAMRRATAFVTDVGGITSHAAIVARELNKPCIIGTKIATQVLKDGDEVEVDANEGIVRIIEHAS